MKKRFLLWACLLTAVLTACSGLRAEVGVVEPLEKSLGVRQVELRNCQCPSDMHKLLSEDFQVEMKIRIDEQAACTSTGEKQTIPQQVRAELEKRVEKTYQKMHSEAVNMLETAEIVAPPDKIRLFRIEMIQKTCSSDVSFRMDGKTWTAQYTYELILPTDSGFWEISCTA
jgi:hypothetical protein